MHRERLRRLKHDQDPIHSRTRRLDTLNDITQEDFDDWFDNPVTQNFFEMMARTIEDHEMDLVDKRGVSANPYETANSFAVNVATRNALETFFEVRWEDIKSEQ